MLIMFRVKNYASLKNDVVLDMRAVSYKDMKSHVVDVADNKVVKTLAVYGKNASGKSNLVSAMHFFKSFVFNQFFYDKEDDISIKQSMQDVNCSPFLLSNKLDDEMEFEIIFYYKDMTYQYGFSIKGELIKNEWLLIDDYEVFDRNNNNISYGKKYEKELKTINKIRKDRLYLGVLDYFSVGAVEDIIDGFKEYLKYHFNIHFELIVEMSVKGIVSGFSVSKRLLEDDGYKKTIEQFVKVADIGIDGILIKKRENSIGERIEQYEIKTIHKVFDDEGKAIGKREFDLEMESSGTIRYFSFIQHILELMEQGGVFIVDEISARLHPILTRFVIDLYQNEKNKKAQLIFTTHDISLMTRKQFRRDEIAFVDKNKKGESSIYTLADIKARSDASFSKDYMYGKYGAIPVIEEDKISERLVGEGIWEGL